MARPRNDARDLLVYLYICQLRRRYHHRGKPIPFTWCHEATRKKLAQYWGESLGKAGQCGAIRKAYVNGKKIAAALAKVYRLSPSLTKEQSAQVLEQRLINDVRSKELSELRACHERELCERVARDDKERAADRAYHAAITEHARQVLAAQKKASTVVKKRH